MLPLRISVLTIIMLAALAGCGGSNPIAIIHFTQLGACRQANFNGRQVNAGQNQAIVIFNVSQVDNTQVNTTWTYDAGNFAVDPPSSPQSNLGSTGPVTIPANQNVPLTGLQGLVAIVASTANADGSDAATTKYILLYEKPQGSSGPGTLSENESTGTSFPFVQNCNSLIG